MRILLTGASGFLGNIICGVLKNDEIIKIGRSDNASIKVDLCKYVPVLPKCDLIIHAAGKAHSLPKTEYERREFFHVNLEGTKNFLNGITAEVMPTAFVFISTVAVYGKDCGIKIDEGTPLNATDPYGLSKIEAEKIIQEWCAKNKVVCTILRLPLIAGYNPPGNLKAMIEGIRKGYYFNVAGGSARKSVVLAEDVARAIPKVSQIGGVFNLTDGHHPSFFQLSRHIAGQLKKRNPFNMPRFIALLLAFMGDLLGSKAPINSSKLKKITSDLIFDDTKARKDFGWNPTPVLEGFILR